MKTPTLTLALLILLATGQEQLEASPENDTARQQARNASGSVVLFEDQNIPHSYAASADEHQHAHDKRPAPSLVPLNRSGRFCLRLASMTTDKWTLLVTTLYLVATVLIWLQMVKSNKHAEKTRKEGKDAADADRELMGKQLAEMKTSGTLMLRQLEASERPWVTASFEADTPLRFDATGGLRVGFKMWLKNIGHSIATHINVENKIVLDGVLRKDHMAVVAAQDEIAQRLKPRDTGPVLFAGEEVPIFVPLNEGSFETYAIHYEGEPYLLLCLAVVIKYRYPTSDRDHTTRIAFAFGYEYGPMDDLLGVKFGETLPADKITILRLTSGGGAD